METNKKHIYFLCPGIKWDKPTTGGLLYNFVFINALKKQFGDDAVTPLNLLEDVPVQSWGRHRITANLKYLKYFLGKKLGKSDIILIDSRANSLLLLPLIFLRYFSSATIGITIYHIYHHLSDSHGILGLFQKYSEKLFICSASFIITISKSTLKGISQLTGRTENGKIPIQIIPPGLYTENVTAIETKSMVKNHSELLLLYVGTCDDPRKGLHVLIRAIAKLPHSQFKIYLVGKYNETSPYYRNLVQCVADCSLTDNVRFLGRVSAERLQQIYCQADIFVFPSLWEGYGIVLAEAMAYGLPVVATNVSSIPEIVSNGENGILVSPNSVESLTKALAELMDDVELRQQMADTSIKIAKRFKSWDEVGKLLVEFIEESSPNQ